MEIRFILLRNYEDWFGHKYEFVLMCDIQQCSNPLHLQLVSSVCLATFLMCLCDLADSLSAVEDLMWCDVQWCKNDVVQNRSAD